MAESPDIETLGLAFFSPTMNCYIGMYKMKFCLFCKRLEEIQSLFFQTAILTDVYHYLIMKEREKNGEQEYQGALREMCEDFKAEHQKFLKDEQISEVAK